jgi:hypothetical protein
MPSQRGDDCRRVFPGDFYECGETRMAFTQFRKGHQCRIRFAL